MKTGTSEGARPASVRVKAPGWMTSPTESSLYGFHDLRHACGSLLIAESVNPKLVQAILRHSKISTTMDLYVHAYDEDLRGAVASLDRALGS